jgi:hypothetical protein
MRNSCDRVELHDLNGTQFALRQSLEFDIPEIKKEFFLLSNFALC